MIKRLKRLANHTKPGATLGRRASLSKAKANMTITMRAKGAT
jgi:hypothetical protein